MHIYAGYTNLSGDKSMSDTEACDGWDNAACEGSPYCPPRCPRFLDGDGAAVLIRRYTADDFDALVSMYDDIDATQTTMGLPPVTERRRREWLRTLTDDGWNLIARAGERIVGHVGVAPMTAADPEFVVFVHQSFQNRGLGTEMLMHLIAYAGDRGHDELNLSVSADNTRAITVYENIGFDIVERMSTTLEMTLPLRRPTVERAQRPPAYR